MSRRIRQNKTQQIKEEQNDFLLEDAHKKLEEYKKALELKDKQLSDIKKIMKGAKKSYDSVVTENEQFKNTLETLNNVPTVPTTAIKPIY